MNKYSVIQSRNNPGNFHIRVSEPVLHPVLGFPVDEKVGFSIVMTEDQAKLALEATAAGLVSFSLVGEPNDQNFYNVVAEIPETAGAAAASRTLVTEA